MVDLIDIQKSNEKVIKPIQVQGITNLPAYFGKKPVYSNPFPSTEKGERDWLKRPFFPLHLKFYFLFCSHGQSPSFDTAPICLCLLSLGLIWTSFQRFYAENRHNPRETAR